MMQSELTYKHFVVGINGALPGVCFVKLDVHLDLRWNRCWNGARETIL